MILLYTTIYNNLDFQTLKPSNISNPFCFYCRNTAYLLILSVQYPKLLPTKNDEKDANV